MANIFSNMFSKGTGFFGGFGSIGIIVFALLITLFFLSIISLIAYFFIKRRQWNLQVEFKLPRGVGYLLGDQELDIHKVHGIVNAEWGKGSFNSKRGVVFLKRKGIRKISMKPFDIKKYLQGGNILTVVQVGVEKYLPVLPESFLNMVDDETEEEGALLKTKIDTTEDKSWATQFEREAFSAYSIVSLLKEYAQFIGMGIILVFNFVGFAILYTKIV